MIELLIVIAIVGVIAAIGTGAFSRFTAQAALDGTAQQALSVFEEVRARTLASENDQQFGVHIDESQIVLFIGDTYTSGSPTNEVTLFNSRVTASDISLTGGATNVVFERLTGKADVVGTVTFTLASDPTRIKVLRIGRTGVVEIE